MPIYTRTGDDGTTALYGGKRVRKSDLQVETYGSVDELTSFIGLVSTKQITPKDKKLLITIQQSFYRIMAFLSGAPETLSHLADEIKFFEQTIDSKEKRLPKLTRFVIPGGTEESSLFHICRTVCRRAERSAVRLSSTIKRYNNITIVISYLNRLSDLFFILAREYNSKEVTY